jgi:RNA polymerase sigma-70 factor (ECF subfamily)
LEDEQLAAAAANGDQSAFTVLFERYRRYVYSIAYRVVLDGEEALDITQNVWAKLADRIGQFERRGTFRGWLASLTARQAIDQLRQASRRETATDPVELAELCDRSDAREAPDASSRLNQAQERGWVESAMQCLSPQQRAILALQLLEDLSPKEIAERLGLPDKQVRSQLHRAIMRLREMLP